MGQDFPGPPVAVFCAEDNFSDQARPRRAGLALQQPDVLEPFLTGAPIEQVMITAADPRSIVPTGSPVLRPRGCERLDVGISLGAIVGDGPRPAIAAYLPVLDFMRLDVPQTQTYLARSFPTHKVLGQPREAEAVDPAGLRMTMGIDGELRQDSNSAQMIAPPAELLATIARRCTLRAGDLILCGSPAGRPADADGPWVSPGSLVVGEIAGLGAVSAVVVEEDAA